MSGANVVQNRNEKSQPIDNQLRFSFPVPRTRLELARTKRSLPPQSSVSTNFTTWATHDRNLHFGSTNIGHYFQTAKFFCAIVCFASPAGPEFG